MKGLLVNRSTVVSSIIASLALNGSGARAAGADTVRVGRAIAGSFPFQTLEIGQDAHTWERAGVNLDISSFKGDAQLQAAMTAGSIDFALGSGPAMGYRAKGVPAIAIATMFGPPSDLAIVVAANGPIKNVNDFRGKKIGISTSGSLTDWLVHELSRRQGWGSTGIEAVPMGSNEARFAALGTGEIAGTVTDIGIGYELEEQNKGKVLVTFGSFVQKFETHVIFATDDMIARHPDVVRRFLKGWFMTVAYMKRHKAETIRSAAKQLGEPDAVLARVYDHDMPGMSNDGSFDAAAVALIAKSLKELGIMDTEPDPKSIFDGRFVPVKL